MKKIFAILFSLLILFFAPISSVFANDTVDPNDETHIIYPTLEDGTVDVNATKYILVTSSCKDGGKGYALCNVTYKAVGGDKINGVSTTVDFFDSDGDYVGEKDINKGVNPAATTVYGQAEEYVGGGGYYTAKISGTIYGRDHAYKLTNIVSKKFYVK